MTKRWYEDGELCRKNACAKAERGINPEIKGFCAQREHAAKMKETRRRSQSCTGIATRSQLMNSERNGIKTLGHKLQDFQLCSRNSVGGNKEGFDSHNVLHFVPSVSSYHQPRSRKLKNTHPFVVKKMLRARSNYSCSTWFASCLMFKVISYVSCHFGSCSASKNMESELHIEIRQT